MLDTIGKRLKCCRAATATTPQEIVAYINSNGKKLSYPAYTRWESGLNVPKKKAYLIKYISDFFKEKGFKVSQEWIETGEGFPPQFATYTSLDEDTLFILASKNINKTEIIQIAGTYGIPFVNFGEMCIVSTSSNLDENHGKLCFISLKNETNPIVGIMKNTGTDTVSIENEKYREIVKNEILQCRMIKWILKK